MKFSIVALSGLAAVVAAQSATDSSAAASTATLSPEALCAAKCDDSDVCCKAKCYKVPCPSDAMANDTTSCVAACPQGSGTPQDTDRYASCAESCYSSHFFPATAFAGSATNGVATAAASQTGSDAAASATGTAGSSGSATNTASGTQGGSATASGSAASATNTGAASQLGVQLGSAGIVGALVAAMVL